MSLKTIHSLGIIIFGIAIGLIVFLVVQNNDLSGEKTQLQETVVTLEANLSDLENKYASTTRLLGEAIETLQSDLNAKEIDIDSANKKFEATVAVLQSTQQNLVQSENNLNEEREKVGIISEVVAGITKTVGSLEKISQTDKELLQKYSRVYFLNEHYRPAKLVVINTQYTFAGREAWIHGDVVSHLEALIEASVTSGVGLFVASGFRSFDQQAEIKSTNLVIYGVGSNQFSADQGYSEHQLGTTVDFTVLSLSGKLQGFEKTSSYSWLLNNAHKYGFVLSYPENNSFYIFEPWHWRYVGIALATRLHNENASFYDFDQREINNYLISIFDNN